MIHRPIAIVAPMLVPYLSPTEIQNLSMANAELRALLQFYLFPSINVIDPSFKDWNLIPETCIEDNVGCYSGLPLSFFPSTLTALSTHLPMFPTVVDLTAVTSLTVDLWDNGALLYRDNNLSAPGNNFTPSSQLVNLTEAQALFKNLIHLRITCDIIDTARPEAWNSISFDSLVSLTLPCFLEFYDDPENSYMASICKSLTYGRISQLRSLTFLDSPLDSCFTDKELDKYTLSPVILNLISSDLLPALSTFRWPLSFEPLKPGHNAEGDRKPLYDRKPLLRQLLRASATHAIINSRSTPWCLGISNSHRHCTYSSQSHCVCELMTPILWSDEYNDLLKTAHECQRYIRLPEFFTPYLTVEFGSLQSVESAFSHPAAMTPLSVLRLSFPPPIETSLFNAITRLSLILPVDQDELSAYQPHLSALPVSFPALTHLTMSLAREDWPAPSTREEMYMSIDRDLIFGGLTLPHLELQTLDIDVRIISTELPCGDCKMNFGAAQAKQVVLRWVQMCVKCWDPLHRIGTEEIAVFGVFDLDSSPVASEEIYIQHEKLLEWEAKIVESFGCGGRRVTVARDCVGWV
ncbi:hypothetical protein Q9L58_001956 [Maublancomyces gigas]|uniref:F-box domain-containing protein n=1 Tax=Discina gigas TaxID=1032678 RepID=A0ABR3GT27_9PEZI